MNKLEMLLTELFTKYGSKLDEFDKYILDNTDKDPVYLFDSFWQPIDPILLTQIKEEHKCMLAVSS
jgi:hypothetical protein